MNMTNYVIGLDQGTTGSFIALMNRDGEFVNSAYKAHQQRHPNAGWVEQNPDELWQIACELLNQVISGSGVSAREIAGIGIANQGESVVMWDRQTGTPITPVLVWQDTRTQAAIDKLAADPDTSGEVVRRTGLKLDSYFSASKIRWLLDHVSGLTDLLHQDRLACGTLDSWLIWKLTGGRAFVTDASTASRTLLFNIHSLRWDDWLLDLFDIPIQILPDVKGSTGEFGRVSHPDLLCQNIPILASLVDQPAAMIGHGCLEAGQIKTTYGTGCFINLNTGEKPVTSQHGLLTMLAWQRDGKTTYGLDGGVFAAGASLNWLREKLQLFADPQTIDEECCAIKNSGGVVWIPAQIGLGAPYWNRGVRGAWLGLDLASSQAQLTRAVLEGIAARVAQIVLAMSADTQLPVTALRVDGGMSASAAMMQIQADLLGLPVEVIANREATTRGVCGLTAHASGLWGPDDVLERQVRIARTHEPGISQDERDAILDRFDRAIRHLEAWHKNE
jgi:glycerol kinase